MAMVEQRDFKLAGVIGWPVFQSRSPIVHAAWMRQYGILGAYVPMAVQPGRLDAALRGLAALGFAGCNITLPHKEAAFALVDRVDPVGERLRAINLVVVERDGSLSGFNKDGYGFTESLKEAAPGWLAAAGPAVVLGAGGGARSVVCSLLDAGVPEVRLLNRTRERAERLAATFGGPVTVLDWDGRGGALAGAALLVNTTKLGMTGQPPLELELAALPVAALVADIVYNPLETKLLAAARARGNDVVNGLGMLLHQARPAFQAWFGIDPEITPEIRRAIEATV
jgi:shikimate dehydrogenase